MKLAKVMLSQVSVCPKEGGLGLCPGGVSVKGRSLLRGVSVKGVSVQERSLSRESLSRGSLSRGVSVQGSLSRGFSVQGGLCPEGLCPGGSLSWRPTQLVMSRWTPPTGMHSC